MLDRPVAAAIQVLAVEPDMRSNDLFEVVKYYSVRG